MSALSKKDQWVIHLLIFLTFDLMLLGAGVRTMDAGLTCPDWPLCFGKVVPKYHFGVYLEFIHRVIAGMVGLLYLYFFIQVWRKPILKKVRLLSLVGLFLLVAQIIMGGLTVLKLLEAYIVTMHLSLATLFLLCLYMIKQIVIVPSFQTLKPSRYSLVFKRLVQLSLVFVIVQIVLGGLVASTYSGLVCIDFPTCNGQYFPKLVGPIGIQMLHRFGAYWLSLLITLVFLLAIFSAKKMDLPKLQKIRACKIFFLLVFQIFIGVMNLKYLMPAFLSVLHLALALTILLSLVRLNSQISLKV